MDFVGASWGANLPVTKVMLLHSTCRWQRRTVATARWRCCWLVEAGGRPSTSASAASDAGLQDGSVLAVYALGLPSNPITAAAIQVAGRWSRR
jgi:hypothetical protein